MSSFIKFTPETLKNNPFMPPKDGRCLINTILPIELLSHIFEIGAFEEDPKPEPELNEPDSESDTTSHDSDDSWQTEDSNGNATRARRPMPEGKRAYLIPEEFQILVSHVCKHWRDVALNNPFLWSTIEFEGYHTFDMNIAYLDRAQDAPLTISIDCALDDEERSRDEDEALKKIISAIRQPLYVNLRSFLRLITPRVKQWQSLEVMVSHYLLMQLVLETLGNITSAPMLEVLQLYFYEDDEELVNFQPPSFKDHNFVLFHGNAPNLSKVSLWGVHLNWSKSTFLSGLIELELTYHALDVRPAYRDFLRIVETSPDLRSLSLGQSGPAGTPVDWLDSVMEGRDAPDAGEVPMSITLPVSDLMLGFLPQEYVLALLDKMHLPNLTSLALDFEEEDHSPLLSYLSHPRRDSNKSLIAGLDALKVSGLHCDDFSVLCHAFTQMQNLRTLFINCHHLGFLWYRLLFRPELLVPGVTMFCPRLEALTIAGAEGFDVRQLVEERLKRGCPLKRVRMEETNDLDFEDEMWMAEHLESLDFFECSDDEDEIIEIDMEDTEDENNNVNNLDQEMAEEDDENNEWTDVD